MTEELTQSPDDRARSADTERRFGAAQAMRLVGPMAASGDDILVENIDNEIAPSEAALFDMETISASFKRSEQTINKIRLNDSFQEYIVKRSIHPYKQCSEQPYWINLNNYVRKMVRDSPPESESDRLQAHTLQLLAATPNFIFAQTALSQRVEKNLTDRAAASTYNGLIRDMATSYPGLTASGLSRALANGLQATMKFNAPPLPLAAAQVNRCIRGAQHEMAFGAFLSGAGLAYRTTTVSEDLKGIDYVVSMYGQELPVDVKASLSEVEANNSQGVFAIRRGKVIMFSMIKDAELHDSFFLPPEIIAQRAPAVAMSLDEAMDRIRQHVYNTG